MEIVRVENLQYTYPSRNEAALADISFSLEKGSYTAIVGLNGSGKSTLSRILCGLLDVQKGSVTIHSNTQNVSPTSQSVLSAPKIALVFQSPKDQIVCSLVSRDTAFGPQNLSLPKSEVELRTIESLSIVGLLHKAFAHSMTLSLGQMQKEALAGIIALSPDIIILDEAVAMLDPDSRNEIYHFIHYFVSRGNTVIHITHDADAIREAHDVLMLEKGRIVFQGTCKDFFKNKNLSSRITGENFHKENFCLTKNEIALSVTDINFSYDKNSILKNISFHLPCGSLSALTGISGSGKSTLLEIISGLLVPQTGKIFCEEVPSLCQQNSQAALFEQFAADDVAFGPQNLGVKGSELFSRVQNAMNDANIPFDEYANRQTFTLSGGEARRLSIAGIIALGSKVILFDEPTAGLDSPSRQKVLEHLANLTKQGKTILFTTHRNDEARFADFHFHLQNGNCIKSENYLRDIEAHEKKFAKPTREQKAREGIKILQLIKETIETSIAPSENKSFIARIPPLAKIILFLSLFVSSLAFSNIFVSLAIFFTTIFYSLFAHYPFLKLVKSFLRVLPFLFLFCLFQIIFLPNDNADTILFHYKFFTLTISKIFLCAITIIHTESAIACITTFSFTTPEYDLVDGLALFLKPLSLVRIPVRQIVIVIEIIFRFIPLLLDEASEIIKTQIIRGGLGKSKGIVAKVKAILPLFIPLVVQTIHRSEALADALTVRGFK